MENSRRFNQENSEMQKEQEKYQLFIKLFELGESEISASVKLDTFVREDLVDRRIFSEDGSTSDTLREADEIDLMVDKANFWSRLWRERLLAEPEAVKLAHERLISIGDEFLELAKTSASISDDEFKDRFEELKASVTAKTHRSGLSVITNKIDRSRKLQDLTESDDKREIIDAIITWQGIYKILTDDLSSWATIVNNSEKNVRQTELEKRRADKELERLNDLYGSTALIFTTLIRLRMDMVMFILKKHGFNGDDWSKFIQDPYPQSDL